MNNFCLVFGGNIKIDVRKSIKSKILTKFASGVGE